MREYATRGGGGGGGWGKNIIGTDKSKYKHYK